MSNKNKKTDKKKEDFLKAQNLVIRNSHQTLKFLTTQILKVGIDPIRFFAIWNSEIIKIEKEYYQKVNKLKEKDKNK